MPNLDPFSWTQPASPAAVGKDAPVKPGGPAAGILLGFGSDPHHESRRIAFGLALLALVSIVLLNFGILESARQHLTEKSWAELVAHTDTKREEIRDVLWRFERQSTYVSEQTSIRRWAALGARGALTPAEREAFEHGLERARTAFGFEGIHLIAGDGSPIVPQAETFTEHVGLDREIAIRASLSGKPLLDASRGEASGHQVMTFAVPIVEDGGRPVVLEFHASTEDVLLPLLMNWPGFGSAAGSYLVRREGDDLVFVTSPPANLALQAGQKLAIGAAHGRAAEMAVEGVESSVESPDAKGRALWTVTRALPEYGWGLVGQADRDAMLAPLRGTIVGLLVLDLAMLALGLAAFFFWRRQYRSGLAQREIEITERHIARVQTIFDTAFDAILTFDRSGRIATVNRSAEKLFGRPASELDGEPIQRFLHRLDGDTQGPFALPAPGTITRCEAVRADGAILPVEFSLGTSGDGEELLHTAIVRDISERVESEKRIRAFADGLEVSNRRLEEANAQLEGASRLKSEFLANTSHELRTPLNGMIGFLQLILDGLCDSKEEERDFMNQALACSRHLLGLINDVLDIAKIEAGKLSVEVEKLDVHQLFDEVYTVTHVQSAQKGVKLVFQPPEDSGSFVRGDFGKVKQVLINLVGNSLKFTPKGTITVRGSAHPDLGHFMFEVIDTGIGIHPSRQQLVFEKFTQGDGSTTRKYGGTGLGLAISRSLVELMGGIIGVHSDGEGKGTRMYFSLPLWNEEAERNAPPDESTSDMIEGPEGGSLVLIVEDDATFRHYLKSLLHAHGYRTVEARHAEGGWVVARRLRPSVVVLDYAMSCPEGANLRTGWDLAERMTSDPKTRHIPVIFVTGFDAELKEKLRSTAFSRRPEHLMKPIDGSVLLAKIEQLTGSVHGRTVRLLMADDDPSVSAFIRKVLPEERFHVEVARNGEECLHALRTQPREFDLLLLDLMMPEISGYDVLREMTLAGVGSEIPVLVLTNFPEGRNDEERRLLEQGLVLDVLPKSSVHDNPQLLPHVIDWHLQVVAEGDADIPSDSAGDEPEAEAA
jgi:PAS domain S-box-containing protein